MIRFEEDDRTRGEQLVLGVILQGKPLAASDWQHVCPEDFAHDLHGQIFRHASGLAASGIRPNPAAVFESMRQDRRKHQRAPALDGVAEYLQALSLDASLKPGERVRWLIAFHDATLEQHAGREASSRGCE